MSDTNNSSPDTQYNVDINTPVGFELADSTITGTPCATNRKTGTIDTNDGESLTSNDRVELHADYWSVETEETHRIAGQFVVLDTITVQGDLAGEHADDTGHQQPRQQRSCDPSGSADDDDSDDETHYVFTPEAQADDPTSIDCVYRTDYRLSVFTQANVEPVANVVQEPTPGLSIDRRFASRGPFDGKLAEVRLIGSYGLRPQARYFLPER